MTSSVSKPVWVVIPAAGVGKRMQLELPKQYLRINNKTVIEHTLDCFFDHEHVAGVVVALNLSDPYWKDLEVHSKDKPLYTVDGGENRSDSVIRGLDFLNDTIGLDKDSWVMVHDAVRPCLNKSDIDSLLTLCDSEVIGGLLASPVRDTMKRAVENSKNAKEKKVLATESRENLWHAQTPQMFRLDELKNSLQHCKDQNLTITDESSAMENIGHQPILVEGSHNNIKVTHPSDFELVTLLLSNKRDI